MISMKPTFPKIGNKHNLQSILTPAQHLKEYRVHIWLPKIAIFIYSSRIEKALVEALCLEPYSRSYKTGYNHYSITGYINKTKTFIVIPLKFGAPITGAYAEELTLLGVKKIIIIGAAGGISPKLNLGDLVLCTKAVRDEGVSHHYIKNSLYAYPSKGLTSRIALAMNKNKVKFTKGATWTIDTPYAESKKEIEHYRKLGILTVEMEASALFAIAKRRKFEAAAIFIVSDLLGERWSGFQIGTEHYKHLAEVARFIA